MNHIQTPFTRDSIYSQKRVSKTRSDRVSTPKFNRVISKPSGKESGNYEGS